MRNFYFLKIYIKNPSLGMSIYLASHDIFLKKVIYNRTCVGDNSSSFDAIFEAASREWWSNHHPNYMWPSNRINGCCVDSHIKSNFRRLIFSNSKFLNAHFFIVHSQQHQRPPVNPFLEFLNRLLMLLHNLVIFGEFIGGNLEGTFLCCTYLPLSIEFGFEIWLWKELKND